MSAPDNAFRLPEDWQAEQAATERRRRAERRQVDLDIAGIFAGPSGQRVMQMLIDRFAGETYCRGDPHHTAYREGQRSVIEHLARAIGRAGQPQEESAHD